MSQKLQVAPEIVQKQARLDAIASTHNLVPVRNACAECGKPWPCPTIRYIYAPVTQHEGATVFDMRYHSFREPTA